MRLPHAAWIAAALLLAGGLGLSSASLAMRYPPGPGGAFPDTLTMVNVQNSAAVPFPAMLDSLYGIGGIITAFDAKATGYAFYMQSSTGAKWTGVDVFTGAFNKSAPPWSFALGDSVVVYGRKQEFQGETEIEGFDGVQSTDDDCIVRLVSSGNPVPAFTVLTTTQARETPTNTTMEQYEGMLLRVNQSGAGTMKVGRTVGLGTNAFIVVDSAAPSDSVFVDGNTLATYPAPALNAVISRVQGIASQRTRGYRIQLRDGSDIVTNTPPNVTDAYPIADDQIRVVFDRDVTTATAANPGNYALASLGSVTAAAMDGTSAAILTISNGLPHGVTESVTANSIAGLVNNVAMTSGQSRTFVNGVLSCAEVQMPAPDSLAAPNCVDRSRLAGSGGQASQGGFGARCTVVGVSAAKFATLDYLADEAGGFRSGLTAFGSPLGLSAGRKYMIVGQVQEFFGETQFAGIVRTYDLGPALAPSPATPAIGAIDHDGCDATQTLDDAEDYEGRLVRVDYGKVVLGGGLIAPSSSGFYMTHASGTDTVFVSNLNGVLDPFVPPVLDATVRVTGIVHYANASFRICPRSEADIEQVFLIPYTLTVTTLGEGGVIQDPPGLFHAFGTMVRLAAIPDSGNRFLGWEGDTTATADTLVLRMDRDWSVVAHFEPLPHFDVLAVADTGGQVQISPTAATYAFGETVSLLAIPDAGYAFVGWGGDTAAFANPLDIVVRRDRSLVARFVRTVNGYSACVVAPEGGVVHLAASPGGTITAIEFASYGTPSGNCGGYLLSACHAARSLAIVESLAVGRSACDIPANDDLFGSPCGASPKYLVVQYHVEGSVLPGPPTEFLCATVSEGDSLVLAAPAGMLIDSVLFASFGTPAASGPDSCWMSQGACHASSSRVIVEVFALGKTRLAVLASSLVFGDPCPGTPKRLSVKLRCAVLGPDLAAALPVAWPAAVVPSSVPLGTGTPPPPTELFGDSASTYLTAAYRSLAWPVPDGWTAGIAVDGGWPGGLTPTPDSSLGSRWYSVRDVGPGLVAGGWHTLSSVADASGTVTEQDETNNIATSQWLWRPRMIARGVDYLRDCPPDVGAGLRPNCDAVSFIRDPRYAWVVASGFEGPYDKYFLSVCDDYFGPTSGLSHKLAESLPQIGEVDFVVGGSTSSPSLLYAVMTRGIAFEGRTNHVQLWDSRGAFSDVGTGVWTERVLAAGQLAQVYELYFEDTAPKYLALRCIGGGGLAFEVFDQAVAGKHSCGARGWSLSTSAGYDSLVYIPQRTGWHSVVLYRTGLGRAAITYTFLSQSHPVLSADNTAVPARLELSQPSPNPIENGTSLQLALPVSARSDASVYDVLGRHVRRLCDSVLPAGRHELRWDGAGDDGARVAPGLYLVQARVGDWRQVRRVVVR